MKTAITYYTKRGARRAAEAVVNGQTPVIAGRASDCGIHLSTLAVSQRHVLLDVLRPGILSIDALSEQTILVNGKPERSIDVPIGNGVEVDLDGAYKLTLTLKDDTLCIDVDQTQPPETGQEIKESVFALKTAGLSKRSTAWVLAVLVALLGVVLPITVLTVGKSEARVEGSNQLSVQAAADAPFPEYVTSATGSIWLAGGISSVHRGLVTDCTACHATPFQPVTDKSCAQGPCHQDMGKHAETDKLLLAAEGRPTQRRVIQQIEAVFGKAEGRCTSCHIEHDTERSMREPAQTLCSDCHTTLTQRVDDAKIGDAGDFATSHPQFRPTIAAESEPGATRASDRFFVREKTMDELNEGRDTREAYLERMDAKVSCRGYSLGKPNFRGLTQLAESKADIPSDAFVGDAPGLVFPHALHVAKDGCVEALANTLGLPKPDCKTCHIPEGDGKYFKPITMETNCSLCHSLTFDLVDVPGSGTIGRSLRHGDPFEVVSSILENSAQLAPVRAGPPSNFAQRRRPGQRLSEAQRAPLRASIGSRLSDANSSGAARVRGVFSAGGACYGCHEIVQPTPQNPFFDVKPVTLQNRYLPHGLFDHTKHSEDCQICHRAETSQTSADVLLPSIGGPDDIATQEDNANVEVQTCRSCHGGPNSSSLVPSSCVMCHDYHFDIARKVPTESRFKQPTRARPLSSGPSQRPVGGLPGSARPSSALPREDLPPQDSVPPAEPAPPVTPPPATPPAAPPAPQQ